MDDLIDTEFGKHDYDWLVTPPKTPLVPSNVTDHQTVPSGRSTRSVSTARASRVSTSQLQNGHSTKPARSSSVIRRSTLNTYSSLSTNSNNRNASILNTSIASVTGSSLTSCSVPARSETLAKARPTPISPGVKTTKSHNCQIPTNSNSTVSSSSPRLHPMLTPTKKSTNSLSSPTIGRSASVGLRRRLSSPSPRARTPVEPIDIPDFLSDAPPNLRTKMPERAASAGKVRPGAALTTRANLSSQNVDVRHRKFSGNSPKAEFWRNGHHTGASLIQKSVVLEGGFRRANKVGGATESSVFGRTISKKSLDMAMMHMDINQSYEGIRRTSLFPRSSSPRAPKGRPAHISVPMGPLTTDGAVVRENDTSDDKCGSSQYEIMLVQESSGNMNSAQR